MKSTRRKIDLYILSLGLLFVFLVIITIKVPDELPKFHDYASWEAVLSSNVVTLISLLMLAYCIFAYKRFDFDLRGATDIPFEITKIKGINYEHLTFLATYVVPLISFDFGSTRQLIVLGLLLIAMGAMYIKTDLFYANPSLALLGFHIYEADGDFKNGTKEGIILICRNRLEERQKVSYIKLDDRIYYVNGTK